jgi:hypothetical protein
VLRSIGGLLEVEDVLGVPDELGPVVVESGFSGTGAVLCGAEVGAGLVVDLEAGRADTAGSGIGVGAEGAAGRWSG